MEHTLWELILFLVLTPLALTAATLVYIDHLFRQMDGDRNPDTLGRIVELAQVERAGPLIGHLGGMPIYDYLDLHGRRFAYDRPVRPGYRLRVQPDELFMVPGLVYRAPDRKRSPQKG